MSCEQFGDRSFVEIPRQRREKNRDFQYCFPELLENTAAIEPANSTGTQEHKRQAGTNIWVQHGPQRLEVKPACSWTSASKDLPRRMRLLYPMEYLT